MAKLTNTTIYGAANITGNVVTTGFAFDVSAINGINISNANSISSIILTNNGSQYLSVPSIVISAPTTGGATANANAVMRFSGSIAAGNVGVGYANGDILYANVAGSLQNAWFTVTSNTATTYGTGGINGISVGSLGQYFTIPPGSGAVNPYITITGTTSATGVGANLQSFSGMAVNNVYFQTTGSGYVEQPTVTITGGSPSIVATAYATVGTGTQVRSLGSTISFYTPGGEQLRIIDTNTTTINRVHITGGGAGISPVIYSSGSGSTGLNFSSAGTSGLTFYTNGASQTQFNISHTPSAVNYVQATGAATGSGVTISAQGSDANIFLNLNGKSSGGVRTQYYHIVGYGYNNYLSLSGNSTGGPVGITAAGSDANVALSISTQGNAAVQITGNSSGYIPAANSIYVGNRVGFANSNNISVVYQTWNTTTNSLDVVYG